MKTNKKRQNIVTIGGGSGSFMVLTGLKKHPVDLSAIVNMVDDGGSTGILRDEMGVLPPGDVRQCLVALSYSTKTLRDLFNYRYGQSGGLNGHNFGNIFLSTLEKITGGFDTAVVEASRILRIKGYVLPVTLKSTRLVAVLENGREVFGEKNIYCNKGDFCNLKKLYLKPAAPLNPKIIPALKKADKIVINPGDLYSSLIPNFLVQGLPEAIAKSRAKVICVVNLMTKPGQTEGFDLGDYISNIEKYLGKGVIKYVIFNTEIPDEKLLKKYKIHGEKLLAPGDFKKMNNINFIGKKLLSHKAPEVDPHDKLAHERSLVRHDSDKLARIIYKI